MSEAPVDFNALLDKQADEVRPPEPLPFGTYTFMVRGKEYGTSTQKHTPYVRFFLKPQSPDADVDTEALSGVDLSTKELRDDFYLTEAAMFRLKNFIEACGIETTGRKMLDLVNSVEGAFVKAHVKIVPNKKDPNHKGYNEIDAYTKVD